MAIIRYSSTLAAISAILPNPVTDLGSWYPYSLREVVNVSRLRQGGVVTVAPAKGWTDNFAANFSAAMLEPPFEWL
jgi:hypothetical protein